MAGHIQVITHQSHQQGHSTYLDKLYNFIITTFDCHGGGISARAFALARIGVALPLLSRGVHPHETMTHSPLFHISPLFPKKFSGSAENFPDLTFSPKFSDFHPSKFLTT